MDSPLADRFMSMASAYLHEDKTQKATISGIEMFHKTLDEGQSGDQHATQCCTTRVSKSSMNGLLQGAESC